VIVNFDLRSCVVLAAVDEPLHDADEQDDCKRNDAVVHIAPCYRELRREDEEDRGDDDVGDAEQVGEPGKCLRKLEVASLRQHTTASHAVDCNWNGIADTQGGDRCGSDGIESACTAEEDAAEDDHHEQCKRE
jgi:hypothetical protein